MVGRGRSSAKLPARVRALGGGSGRKTDDTDAYAVAVAGLRGRDLEPVQPDEVVTVLKLMSDRRQQLVEQRIASITGCISSCRTCCLAGHLVA